MDGGAILDVLLVEDNPGDARLVVEALRAEGAGKFGIHLVDSLKRAVELLQQSSFDAIVVDLSLPDANGLEAVKKLVALSPDTPVLVLSGDQDESLAISAVHSGAQDFLIKGAATSEFLSRSIRYAHERKRQGNERAHFARIDTVTGLPNRAHFNESFSKALNRAQRSGGTCALFYLDLNDFKSINDTMGHPAGDELLRGIAQRLSACLRHGDTVCRIGGDEFALILEGVGGSQGAIAAAYKISDVLSEAYELSNACVRASASIGVALYPQDGDEVTTLVQLADDAMYVAKREGRRFAFNNAASDALQHNRPPRKLQAR